jgi:hypothetical protein
MPESQYGRIVNKENRRECMCDKLIMQLAIGTLNHDNKLNANVLLVFLVEGYLL